ncbi:MAG: prolipoprotein diacylglyceryl transferase [Clostridia bacterium]|nr:prolipoprotein diacylglyceryl transferase [Clostridia bacterium]
MNDTTVVSFPGIGIEEMTINKVAFELPILGGLEVRWYGILLTLGIVAGFLYALYRAKFEGFTSDDVIDYALVTVVLAIIGARTYYVLTTLDKGLYNSFYDVIAIWEGGIAMYGSIIGGALGLLIVSRFKKLSWGRMIKIFDMVAPGVMLGQIIGRWGNFVNGEAHGVATSENFFLRMGLSYGGRVTYYHPTFLYESLWNLVGFVLITTFYKKKKFDGQIVLSYLAWYGFGRMFIEGLRTDSLYIGEFRISQVVGFLCFVICTVLLIYMLVRKKREELDGEAYAPVYEKCRRSPLRSREKEQAVKESQAQIDAIIAHAEQKKENEENGKVD